MDDDLLSFGNDIHMGSFDDSFASMGEFPGSSHSWDSPTSNRSQHLLLSPNENSPHRSSIPSLSLAAPPPPSVLGAHVTSSSTPFRGAGPTLNQGGGAESHSEGDSASMDSADGGEDEEQYGSEGIAAARVKKEISRGTSRYPSHNHTHDFEPENAPPAHQASSNSQSSAYRVESEYSEEEEAFVPSPGTASTSSSSTLRSSSNIPHTIDGDSEFRLTSRQRVKKLEEEARRTQNSVDTVLGNGRRLTQAGVAAFCKDRYRRASPYTMGSPRYLTLQKDFEAIRPPHRPSDPPLEQYRTELSPDEIALATGVSPESFIHENGLYKCTVPLCNHLGLGGDKPRKGECGLNVHSSRGVPLCGYSTPSFGLFHLHLLADHLTAGAAGVACPVENCSHVEPLVSGEAITDTIARVNNHHIPNNHMLQSVRLADKMVLQLATHRCQEPHCTFSAFDLPSILEHLITAHNDTNLGRFEKFLLDCPYCVCQYPSLAELREHVEIMHEGFPPVTTKRVGQCLFLSLPCIMDSTCKAVIHSVDELIDHISMLPNPHPDSRMDQDQAIAIAKTMKSTCRMPNCGFQAANCADVLYHSQEEHPEFDVSLEALESRDVEPLTFWFSPTIPPPSLAGSGKGKGRKTRSGKRASPVIPVPKILRHVLELNAMASPHVFRKMNVHLKSPITGKRMLPYVPMRPECVIFYIPTPSSPPDPVIAPAGLEGAPPAPKRDADPQGLWKPKEDSDADVVIDIESSDDEDDVVTSRSRRTSRSSTPNPRPAMSRPGAGHRPPPSSSGRPVVNAKVQVPSVSTVKPPIPLMMPPGHGHGRRSSPSLPIPSPVEVSSVSGRPPPRSYNPSSSSGQKLIIKGGGRRGASPVPWTGGKAPASGSTALKGTKSLPGSPKRGMKGSRNYNVMVDAPSISVFTSGRELAAELGGKNPRHRNPITTSLSSLMVGLSPVGQHYDSFWAGGLDKGLDDRVPLIAALEPCWGLLSATASATTLVPYIPRRKPKSKKDPSFGRIHGTVDSLVRLVEAEMRGELLTPVPTAPNVVRLSASGTKQLEDLLTNKVVPKPVIRCLLDRVVSGIRSAHNEVVFAGELVYSHELSFLAAVSHNIPAPGETLPLEGGPLEIPALPSRDSLKSPKIPSGMEAAMGVPGVCCLSDIARQSLPGLLQSARSRDEYNIILQVYHGAISKAQAASRRSQVLMTSRDLSTVHNLREPLLSLPK